MVEAKESEAEKMTEMQVVKAPWWSDKDFYVRRSRNYGKPSRGELRARIRFATAATRQFGRRGLAPNGNPIVAEAVKTEIRSLPPIGRTREELTDAMRASLRRKMREKGLPFVELPEKYRPSEHFLEDGSSAP